MQKEIIKLFLAFKQLYGYRRITVETQNLEYPISCTGVNKHMKVLGLNSRVKKNRRLLRV
jgi:hypothetical protein